MMRSFSRLALGLALVNLSLARVTQRETNPQASDGVVGWLKQLLKKSVAARTPSTTCYADEYYTFVHNSSFGESFCREHMPYAGINITETYTPPPSTSMSTYSTRTDTTITTVRDTPDTTITVTASGAGADKRHAQPTDMPLARVKDAFGAFRRQKAEEGDSIDADDDTLSASFSSACACQTYGGSSSTVTYTKEPAIVTRSGFDVTITTITTSQAGTGSTRYITITPTASPSDGESMAEPTPMKSTLPESQPTDSISEEALPVPSSTTTQSGAAAEPTAPAFSCPQDNSTVVSQMIGSYRYDYLVLCDLEVTDDDSYSDLSYSSFSECVAACSVADTRFNSPVCKGISYYAVGSNGGYNCFLKASASSVISAPGVDSGVLQRVLLGITEEDQDGTSTAVAPFEAAETGESADMSSSFSSMFTDSSTSIALITPGPMGPSARAVNADGETSYSTYVYNGTTYSTGTNFNYYTSNKSNGQWYSAYYTSYSMAWESGQVVYGTSESGTTVANSTESDSSKGSTEGGGYWESTTTNTSYPVAGGVNVTSVTSNVTYDEGGNQISSTATTQYYAFATGESSGGAQGSDAGIVTSTFPGTTSTFISSSILSGGVQGGAGGAAGGGAPQTAAPSTYITTVVSSGDTVFSTAFILSGGQGGIAKVNSTAASGYTPSSGAPPVPISPVVSSAGVKSGSGGAGGGAMGSFGSSPSPATSTVVSTGISGESSAFGSGVFPSSMGPSISVSSTQLSTGIRGQSESAASGFIPSSGAPLSPLSSIASALGTGLISSSEASGAAPSSDSLAFSNTKGGRSGTLSRSGTGGATSGSQQTFTQDIPIPPFPTTSSSVLVGTAPIGTAPTLTGLVSSTGASGSAPIATGPSSPADTPPSQQTFTQEVPFPPFPTDNEGFYPSDVSPTSSLPNFTNSKGPRTGTLHTSSATAASGTAPRPPFSSERPGTGVLPPSGSGPSATVPINTGSVPTSSASNSVPGFSNTDRPRSGTSRTTPVPPFPTESACVTNILGTTTIFQTITEFGCAGDCAPAEAVVTTTEFGCAGDCAPAAATTTEYGCYSYCAPDQPGGGYGPPQNPKPGKQTSAPKPGWGMNGGWGNNGGWGGNGGWGDNGGRGGNGGDGGDGGRNGHGW